MLSSLQQLVYLMLLVTGLLVCADDVIQPRDELSDIACSADTRPAILTNYTGRFASPNFPRDYPDNANCQWLIVSQEPAGWVKLDFPNILTQPQFDQIKVYDGDSTSAPLLASFDGQYNPGAGDVISTQENMLVVFTSDSSLTRLGFEATYTSTEPFEIIDACRPESRPLFVTDASGVIQTKNHPSSYENNQDCQWIIEAQEVGSVIRIVFDPLVTETNSDFVYIYDGANAQSPLIARISGPRDLPSVYRSTQQYMFVRFTSDAFVTRLGFSASFTTVKQ